MTEALRNSLIYGSLAGLGSLVGVILVARGARWLKPLLPLVISFAAGTLLAVAFFDLLPEATEMASASIYGWVLGSFICFYFLEHVLHYHSHHHVEHHHPIGLVAFTGMAFHALIDGIAIAVGFQVSPQLGLVTTVGLLAHQFPQGIAVTSILLHARYSPRRAGLLAAGVAAATPLGAIATALLTRNLPESVLGKALAVAAGSFLYVAASDLIPEAHEAKHYLTGVMLVVGVAVVWAVMRAFGS